jgi:hypothetical protein
MRSAEMSTYKKYWDLFGEPWSVQATMLVFQTLTDALLITIRFLVFYFSSMRGNTEHLVKWECYKEETWEPSSNILDKSLISN